MIVNEIIISDESRLMERQGFMGNRKKNPETFRRIEEYINTYQKENGMVPSNAELSKGLGLSPATISRYLMQMRKDGVISYSGHRTIKTRMMQKTMESSVFVPVLGQVACGLPRFAEENIDEYIPLPKSFVGPGEYFLLKAKGDSMIEIGVDDSDLVLIRHQDSAEPGQIVVALVEDEATLKRFYPEPARNRVRLHPENREMNDIYVSNCEIQGVAVKVIKDIH